MRAGRVCGILHTLLGYSCKHEVRTGPTCTYGVRRGIVSDAVMKLVMQYRPNMPVENMQPEDLRERVQSAVATTKWWQLAHDTQSSYHQQYAGYCPVCVYDKQHSKTTGVVS